MLFERNDLYKLERKKHEKAITVGVLLDFSILFDNYLSNFFSPLRHKVH